jgi:ankyrin repeat protein
VKLLLEEDAKLESKNNVDRTPLFWATNSENIMMVKVLLEKGTEPESKDNDGRTPLPRATEASKSARGCLLQPQECPYRSRGCPPIKCL